MLVIMIIQGCVGSGANPIRVININDQNITCKEVEKEAEHLLSSANFKSIKKIRTNKINLATWIAGQLLLFPMLAMDVKGSSEIEQQAIIKRLEMLQLLSETCRD